MSDTFLDRVYAARTAAETRALYDAWSASYDAEISAQGYVTPGRCAEALRAHMSDPTQPILDFGCGTGLSGLALALAGFTTLDGVDLSAEMLEGARAKGVYRDLTRIEADQPLRHAPGTYAAIAAIGVIGAGAAPISVFDTLMEGLAAGGLLVFSFNDHALQDPANVAKLAEWTDSGRARERFRDYGPHLTGMNLNSCVYIVEKT
ncbi:methyltransferase domain-containing protein [Seohaeicola saemankumensis]|nr:methyltransferase domain-containing protein [Seohaeicola saemankumensis]MCA0872097.1 methyltransferase domain-containing protein [Seohaeicola saemankumensis]